MPTSLKKREKKILESVTAIQKHQNVQKRNVINKIKMMET